MTIRIGILGAANIAPSAVIRPAAASHAVELLTLAARSPSRAMAFADTHGITHVDTTYSDVLERDDIDAVYIPLPASEHHEWVRRALQHGKHVLCEKPLTTSLADAEDLAAAAATSGRVLFEAYHYRYHPFVARILEVVASGELGVIHQIDAVHRNNVPRDWPVYWDAALGGGTTLHTGCYPVHLARTIAGCEPTVHAARARWRDGVDATLIAELRFPNGVASMIDSSMQHDAGPENWIVVRGERGSLRATNFIVPQYGHVPGLAATLDVCANGATSHEVFGPPPTYDFQLAAFVKAVRGGPVLTGPEDSVATMRVLEAMVVAARDEEL